MKKLFSILAAMLFAGSMMAAETVDFSAQGYENGTAVASYTGTDFTVTFAQGTNSNNAPKYYTTGAAIRCYGGNTFTVASLLDMTKIVLTFGSGDGSNAIITDVVTYAEGTWTGTSKSVTFTIDGTTGQRRLAGMTVTFAGEVEPDPEPQPAVLPAVSDSTTWDFAKLTANTESSLYGNNGIQLTDASTPSKNDEIVYSEYKNNLWTVDAAFNDSALAFKGEYPIRKNQYCQNGVLRFNAGVAGNLIVKFSDTGTSASTTAVKRYLVVNGDTTQYWSSRENNGTENPYDAQLNVVTEAIPVPAGDVTITGTAALVIYYVTFVPQVLPTPTNCAEAAAAALSVSANNELYNNGAEYTIEGYVTKIQTAYSDQYHNITFWMADAADGGEVLEAFRAACASEADAPVVGDKVAVTGKLTKYNTTPEFAAGCTFVITEHPTPEPTMDYYVVGTMTNWAPNADYKLAANPAVLGEYMGAFTFAANDEFKVAYSDGNTIDDANWFPTGMGNNYQITEAGEYNIYFRPAGNTEWANGYFTAVKKEVPVIETITVAEAITAGMELDSAATSEADYTVEGFVVNAQQFNLTYNNQVWYMADDAANAGNQEFQAYGCVAIQGNDTLQVLNGDKVQLVGKLFKYYDRKNSKYVIEIKNGVASFVSMVEGDHTIVRTVNQATVTEALALAANLAKGTSTAVQYEITGYVTAMAGNADDFTKYGNQTYWIGDVKGSGAASNADGAFEVYRGVAAEEVHVGDKVMVKTAIKKYDDGSEAGLIESETKAPVTILEKAEGPELPEGVISCDSALVLAAAIADPVEEKATVEGPVVKVRGYVTYAYNASEKDGVVKQSAWLADTQGTNAGVLQGSYLQIADMNAAVVKGDYVQLEGTLAKYKKAASGDKPAEIIIEVINGTMAKVGAEGIENIVLTEKAQKVLVDGVIYIIRDNKMYNIQGERVR